MVLFSRKKILSRFTCVCSEAENILEQVYENCDITEDLFILRLCLLLAETYLTTYNVEKAGKRRHTVASGNPSLSPMLNMFSFHFMRKQFG